MRKWMILGILLVGLLLLVGCYAQTVEDGKAYDFIFSVEKQKNGYTQVWLRNDSIASYCTSNIALGEKAAEIASKYPDGMVRVQFEEILPGDPERDTVFSSTDGCGTIGGESGRTKPLRMLGICIMEPELYRGRDVPPDYVCESVQATPPTPAPITMPES